MGERVRNVPIGAQFILKRTGDRYEFLGHKRDTPGGTRSERWGRLDTAAI